MTRDENLTEIQKFALQTEASTRRLVQLRWTDASGTHVKTVDRRMTIGSAPRVDLSIADKLVSRLHAEVDIRRDGLWVRDLGSLNGTYVQGVFTREARVPDRGEITVGATRVATEAITSEVELWPTDRFNGLVGESDAMRELFVSLASIAATDSSALILGETGTGKEVVARAIHDASPRAGSPFVVVDCAALPESLFESELFGHAKGAFTGAVAARAGAFEAAEGGTLFLDEIGELPVSMQPKLLRVLESRTVRRIGETAHRPVDVRIVSATHRDLRMMVNAKEFREDLYFRLAVLPVTVPALRDRPGDIARLVRHFLGEEATLSPELVAQLAARPWRGNVRELRNFVERARALGVQRALEMTSFDEGANPMPVAPPPPRDASVPVETSSIRFDQAYRAFRERWNDAGEREYLIRLLARHDRNVAEAAKEAELDRTHVYRLLRKHVLSG